MTDNEDDAPITPEVVDDDAEATGRPVRPGFGQRAVRLGSILLVALGGIALMLAVPGVLSPDNVRCTFAKTLIDDANTDDIDTNDVDLGSVESSDDLPCEQAIALANEIPEEDDVPTESTIKTQYLIVSAIGVAQAAAGVLVLRTRARRARTLALMSVAAGIVFPILGLISMVLLLFIFYCLLFSPDARRTFGEPGLLRSRRRPAPE